MKKKGVVRLYNFADADLVSIAKEKTEFMKRDAKDFKGFGISPEMIEALQTKINEFADLPTDLELINEQTAITTAKDAKAEELRVAIRNIMSRAEIRFGNKSPQYKKFGVDALAQQPDADLLITSKRVVRVGNTFLTELAANGLTIAMLENITNLSNEFESLIIDKKMKAGERDSMQEDRVEAGNAIYSELVKYTTVGFAIWRTTDAAKYNDYVIYSASSGGEVTPIPQPTP